MSMTALVVFKKKASPDKLTLLRQDAVLFDQVCNHTRLFAANPPSERGQEELQMDGFRHSGSVSDGPQVGTLQRDRAFGHYALDTTEFTAHF